MAELSKEHRAKISASSKGQVPWNKGRGSPSPGWARYNTKKISDQERNELRARENLRNQRRKEYKLEWIKYHNDPLWIAEQDKKRERKKLERACELRLRAEKKEEERRELVKTREQIREQKILTNRFVRNVMNVIKYALKKKRINKTRKSRLQWLGCSIDFLKQHLEKLFSFGMSWDNYGEWHIDHKRPIASFDLRLEEDCQKCFHYSNLQPLWAIDNFKKNSSWEGRSWRRKRASITSGITALGGGSVEPSSFA
jgi:hypothetical protein